MQHRAWAGLTLAALAWGMATAAAPAHDPPSERARAQALLANQIDLWNRGDLEAALRTYCPSADVTWVDRSGVSHGYDTFARSMRAQFGGGGDRMGRLAIELLEDRLFGDGSSLVVVRWSIHRGGARVMGGISTQLWAECDGRMRVVFEHAS